MITPRFEKMREFKSTNSFEHIFENSISSYLRVSRRNVSLPDNKLAQKDLQQKNKINNNESTELEYNTVKSSYSLEVFGVVCQQQPVLTEEQKAPAPPAGQKCIPTQQMFLFISLAACVDLSPACKTSKSSCWEKRTKKWMHHKCRKTCQFCGKL